MLSRDEPAADLVEEIFVLAFTVVVHFTASLAGEQASFRRMSLSITLAALHLSPAVHRTVLSRTANLAWDLCKFFRLEI